MRIKQEGEFKIGYNMKTEYDGLHSDMMMDFGILRLDEGYVFEDVKPLERVYILLSGEIEVTYNDTTVKVSRDNCFDENIFCLDVDKNAKVTIKGVAADSEVSVCRTENDKDFGVYVYTRENTVSEVRGADTMEDCGRRIVRTPMDIRLAPHSNFMLGEDVHFPGRWAGFPSHHHRQPEIYYYKFHPENGFGLIKLGDEGVLLEQNDTIKIAPSLVHPQVVAPGYAMYFLWIIRHLDGDPYVKPTFEEEHLWVEKPDAKYWPNNI